MSRMNGFARARVNESITSDRSDVSTQMELLQISAAKAAQQIFEELGTLCPGSPGDNDDSEVHGGEEPYDTIDDVRALLTRGDQLSRTPWGDNAKCNRACYIVDTGHTVTVKPKDENSPNKESVQRVEKFLKLWMKENDWQQRQAEVSHRLDRHGEVFDFVVYDETDGMVRLAFAEPTDLDEDPTSVYLPDQALVDGQEKRFIDMLGVRRTNNVLFRPVEYFIEEHWYGDLRYLTPMGRLPVKETELVQHRKRNCLANDPRGVTLYYPVREELTWSKRLLANLMRVSGFQAAFGAIRTIDASLGHDLVRSYLNTQQSGTANANTNEKFDFPSASVVTIPSTVKYEFPETGAGQSNHIEVLVQLLRACASGMKLPEFMLTANVSEGNFASTLVSEGPFHKAMKYEQSLMVAEDERILYQALRFAAKSDKHDLTEEDIANITLLIKPPTVQTRDRKVDFEIRQQLWEDSLLSGKDHLGAEGIEYAPQQAQITLERATEPEPPRMAGTSAPGPDPGMKGDPLKEKGVSSGEPKEDPEVK